VGVEEVVVVVGVEEVSQGTEILESTPEEEEEVVVVVVTVVLMDLVDRIAASEALVAMGVAMGVATAITEIHMVAGIAVGGVMATQTLAGGNPKIYS